MSHLSCALQSWCTIISRVSSASITSTSLLTVRNSPNQGNTSMQGLCSPPPSLTRPLTLLRPSQTNAHSSSRNPQPFGLPSERRTRMLDTTTLQSFSTYICSAHQPTLARSNVSNSSQVHVSPINVSGTSVSCSSSMRTKKCSHSLQTRLKSLSPPLRATLFSNLRCSDLNHSNMYVVGLGLCTFANIASEEMSRDLANEIEKLLGSSNTYIRKKVPFITLSSLPYHPSPISRLPSAH